MNDDVKEGEEGGEKEGEEEEGELREGGESDKRFKVGDRERTEGSPK